MNQPNSSTFKNRPALRRFLLRPALWYSLWVVWLVVLCILSSLSHPGPQIHIAGIDKVEHAVYFCAGGVCLALGMALKSGSFAAALALPAVRWWKIALLVLLTGFVVGGLDEWHQTFTPGRFGLDPWDWLADIIGSALAVPPARLILRLLSRHQPLPVPAILNPPTLQP